MLTKLPKPLFFGLLGMVGCLVGWVAGEIVIKTTSSPAPSGGSGAPAEAQHAPSLIFSNPTMQKRMEAGGAHAGIIKIGLIWNNINDLDLHCVDPSGEEIYFGHKQSHSQGALDIDCMNRVDAAEHIFWEKNPPLGKYKVYVHHYGNHGAPDPTSFSMQVLIPGQESITLNGALSSHEKSEVREFTIGPSTGTGPEPVAAQAPAEGSHELIVVGLWCAVLSIPLGLALVAGQNSLQRRGRLQKKQTLVIVLGGLVAGFFSGAASQLFFAQLAKVFGSNSALLGTGQVVGWGVLGALMGLTMAFFIPNLPRKFALMGGIVGGVIGGAIFVAAQHGGAPAVARAVGACSLGLGIGMMIAIAETLAREAALVVHWGPAERSIINLGPKPVILGSSREADLYLPKEKNFPPVTALVTFREGRIEIENKLSNSRHELKNGSKLQLGDLVVEVQAS